MAKKKKTSEAEPKQYGTLIRVSDEFAEAIREAASFEKLSQREFADAVLLPIVQKRFRDAVLKRAKQIGKDDHAQS